VIVIDTGPVVAAANRKDDYHKQCVDCFRGFPVRSCCQRR